MTEENKVVDPAKEVAPFDPCNRPKPRVTTVCCAEEKGMFGFVWRIVKYFF